ncbi:MAG: capsule assembly Wzi family protein [Chitinispirillales bacterium]|jgi:hypothetical protein|nr:capsule assembly Wzi family protein [Chitinispirillales bacterium]
MRNIFLSLVVCMTSVFALPVVLDDNIHRNAEKDSVYTLRFKNDSEFLLANNFNLRLKSGGIYAKDINNGRIIAYFGDSIGYKALDFVFGVFLDNKAIYGKTLDWVKPEKGNDHKDTLKALDVHRLMLKFTPNDYISIGVGKDYYNFGPSQIGGLLLSDYNMGFTGLYQRYKLWGFTIYGLAAQLNSTPWGYYYEHSPQEILVHRFLAYGRIEYYRDLWGIAVSQAEIYAGNGRSFELQYLIPVFIYHYAQISNWRYGNDGEKSLGSIDAYANFFDKKLKIYGELLIDDIQGDRDGASQSVQNCLGFIAGAKFNVPKIIYGFAEAGQINSYVYNHVTGDALRYRNKEALIGSPLGSDNQIYWGKLGHCFDKIGLKTEAYFWLLRQGERDINYDIETMHGTRKDKIPYGNIHRETAGWLSLVYEYKHNTAEIFGGFSNAKTENVFEDSNTTPFFGFSINMAITIGWNKLTSH